MSNKHITSCFAAIFAGVFSVAVMRGEVTPTDAVLKDDGITRITCAYGGEPATPAPGMTFNPAKGEYHYDLYLPVDYYADPKAVFPCLFVASPSGNARLGVMAERVKRDRFTAVMLVESKNGSWEPGIANFCSAYDDVVKRLRVAEGFKYMTGMSGGARSTSTYTALRPGFVGMFLQAAGFWQTPEGPYAMTSVLENPRLAVYATFGTKDMNLDEAGLLAQYLPPKTAYHSYIFRGGHQWAPRPQVEEAFDWLEQWTFFTLPGETSAAARIMYLNYFTRLSRHCQEATVPFERYEWMEKAIEFAASHGFGISSSLRENLAAFQKETAALAADEAVKKEIVARDAFLKVVGSEETGRRQAGRNAEKAKAAVAQSLKDYQAVLDVYAGATYAVRAAAAIERIKVESSK